MIFRSLFNDGMCFNDLTSSSLQHPVGFLLSKIDSFGCHHDASFGKECRTTCLRGIRGTTILIVGPIKHATYIKQSAARV